MRVIAVVPAIVTEVEDFADVVAAIQASTVMCDTVELILCGAPLAWMSCQLVNRNKRRIDEGCSINYGCAWAAWIYSMTYLSAVRRRSYREFLGSLPSYSVSRVSWPSDRSALGG